MISDALKIAAGVTAIVSIGGGLIYYVQKKEAEHKLDLIKRQVGANVEFIEAYISLVDSDCLSVKQLGELDKIRKDYSMKFATCTYNEMVILLAQTNGIYMTVKDAAKARVKK